jgi:hypothetical protein
MEQWPQWFLDALKVRFDRSASYAEQQPELLPLIQKLVALNEAIKTNSNDPALHLFNEWEDTLTRKHSTEKERLYLQGVQDGIRIIYPALHSKDFR